jgi:hypothetical protein
VKIILLMNLENMLQLKQEPHHIMLQFCLFDEETCVIMNQENEL